MDVAPITDAEKFLARVERRGPSQCWWWNGAIFNDTGFPMLKRRDGSRSGVARFAWEIVYLRGPIPAGFIIMRREHEWENCRTGPDCPHLLCMNPDHFLLVRKSTVDGERLRQRNLVTKTVCRRGHLLTEDNVHWVDRARNKRMCRICYLEIKRRYYRRHT